METEHKGYKIRYSENGDEWSCFDLGDAVSAPSLSACKAKIDALLKEQRCEVDPVNVEAARGGVGWSPGRVPAWMRRGRKRGGREPGRRTIA